jgi:hypothetical protein
MLLLEHLDRGALADLLRRYGLKLELVPEGQEIPGSYWGESEAGLRASVLYARLDTPLHSVLHESCHYICMSAQRRAGLDRDAGGDDAEESAVCYLQVLLSGEIDGCGRARAFADMDAWGYSFRLGTTSAWFHQDAQDALLWLKRESLIGDSGALTWQVRC